MITLSDGTNTITLPGDMLWQDEYTWQPVVQEVAHSIAGALVVESATRLAGRPITLTGDDDMAWVERGTLQQLRAWAATPGKTMTLTLTDGRQFAVVWRHQDAPALEARPVLHRAPAIADDEYVVTIKLMEV